MLRHVVQSFLGDPVDRHGKLVGNTSWIARNDQSDADVRPDDLEIGAQHLERTRQAHIVDHGGTQVPGNTTEFVDRTSNMIDRSSQRFYLVGYRVRLCAFEAAFDLEAQQAQRLSEPVMEFRCYAFSFGLP